MEQAPAQALADEADLATNAVRIALRERLQAGKLELPLLPEVAGQVMAACSDEACDVRRLAQLIQRDQAMAANLLRLGNSALYAPPVPIVSLQQAVSRLGMKKIREIALIISCQTRVFAAKDERVRGLFRHALAAAAFAQEIARLRRWNVEEAFLCGLLHDVGKPVLLHTIADLQRAVGICLSAQGREMILAEGHAEVGATLVESWKLPARLRETILYHHNPTQAPTCAQTAMMTHLADEIAKWALTVEVEPDDRIRKLPVLGSLNIYPEELNGILAKREQVLTAVQSIA